MITIGIVTVLGFLIAWGVEWEYCDPIESFIGGVFGAGFAAFGATIVVLVIGTLAYGGDTKVVTRQTNLVNIADNNHTEGSFFLGSGTIDSVPNYSWYEKTGPNTYNREDVDAYQADIHYITKKDVTPYYKRTRKAHDGHFWHKWALDVGGSDHSWHYDFYIPRGSITNAYKLDAK